MATGGTKVTNKQTVATTNIANDAVTSAKISAATVALSDMACPYNHITLWSGQISGLTAGKRYGVFTIPKDCLGIRVQTAASGAFPTSGLAALKMHLHICDTYGSAVASANLYCAPTIASTAFRSVETSATLTTLAQSGAVAHLMCHYAGSGAGVLARTWVRVTAKTRNIV